MLKSNQLNVNVECSSAGAESRSRSLEVMCIVRLGLLISMTTLDLRESVRSYKRLRIELNVETHC